jgi:hypothetical protein
MPNKWTFKIPPIAELLARYVGDGKGWVDPFAGANSPAEFTNDMNPDMPTRCHMDAEAFCHKLEGMYRGVLYDPPYSYRQIKECYNGMGFNPTQLETSTNFYRKVINAVYEKIETNGLALCFGWNSIGFGKQRGFELIEVLLVCHGQHHNDTICTVERKIQKVLEF